MNGIIRLIVVGLVSAFLAAGTAYKPAFAEAGSTGGTLGKTNKSVSGERQAKTPQPRRLHEKEFTKHVRSAPAPQEPCTFTSFPHNCGIEGY